MRRDRSFWVRVGLAVCLWMYSLVSSASAAVITYWQFDSANFTADSSGNGNVLTNSGATASTDIPPYTTGTSAYFNGSSSMKTTNKLDLTAYNNIAISWWQKVPTSNVGIVWEHSANYNAVDGGIISVVNESGRPPQYVAIHSTGINYNLEGFSYGSNQWEHITAVFNLGLPSGAHHPHERLKVYRNGVLVGSDTRTDNPLSTSFLNDIFYLGARAGTIAPFQGYLDEMKIETVSPYVNMVANDANLVGYWRLSEGSGSTAWEVRGLTGNGTYVNTASGDYAKPGAIRFDPDTAVAFNGTNSYVNAGNDSDLNGAWSGLTIAAWVRPESLSGTSMIAGKWAQNTSYDHFGLFLANGKPIIGVADGIHGEVGLFASSSLVANQWQFVVGTWDATTKEYRLYIDGLLDATGTQSGSGINTGSGAPLGIGAQINSEGGASRYFKGWIDEVAIYNRVLSADEIFQLYATATVPEPTSLTLAALGLLAFGGFLLRRKPHKTSLTI